MIPSLYHSEEDKPQLDTHTKTFDALFWWNRAKLPRRCTQVPNLLIMLYFIIFLLHTPLSIIHYKNK